MVPGTDLTPSACSHPTSRVKFDGGRLPVVCDTCDTILTHLKGTAVAANYVEAARKVMDQYSGWWDGSPEDSWRLERDMRSALGMKPYEEDED